MSQSLEDGLQNLSLSSSSSKTPNHDRMIADIESTEKYLKEKGVDSKYFVYIIRNGVDSDGSWNGATLGSFSYDKEDIISIIRDCPPVNLWPPGHECFTLDGRDKEGIRLALKETFQEYPGELEDELKDFL